MSTANRHPATAYELHCVDASGTVVKNDPVLYAFIWIGILGFDRIDNFGEC